MKQVKPKAKVSRADRLAIKKAQAEAASLAQKLVRLDDVHATTTSLVVAEKFGKQHKNVLRAIENLDCSDQFTRLNFEPSEYIDPTGRTLKMYRLTRDGFIFLVTGFTGKEAAAWKERFIAAFNFYEAEYYRLATRKQNEEWLRDRALGKETRSEFTCTLSKFVLYAKDQGSKSADKYYMNATKMIHKALFVIDEALNIPVRERLTTTQLRWLQMAEMVAMKGFEEGMNLEMPYKDIYKFAKDKVDAFIDMMNCKSEVLASPSELASI